MRTAALVLTAAFLPILAACQSPARQQAQMEQDRTFCSSIGATGNGLANCVMERENQRTQRRIAVSQALANASQQFAVASRPPPRMQTTTCRPLGHTVICNTF